VSNLGLLDGERIDVLFYFSKSGIPQSKSTMVISSSANAEHERDQHKSLTNRRFKSQTSINEENELEEIDYDDDDDNDEDDEDDDDDKNNVDDKKNQSGGSGSDESKENKVTDKNSLSNKVSPSQSSNNGSSSKKLQKQKKWKPLVIEPAKRERRPYRNQQHQPDAYKLNNKRTRSLDRDNTAQQQQQQQQQQLHHQSHKQPNQSDNVKLAKDQIQQQPYARPYARPIRAARYDRSSTTKSYKTHRTAQGSMAPVVHVANAAIRENYKDYLYGDDAIIVEDLSTAGFIYHQPATILPIATTAPLPPQAAVYYASPYDILKQNICYQIEYYFSDENLNTDIYLRRKMDSQGYIDLALLAAFNRIKALTQDIQVIIDAIKHSTFIEINMQELKLRRRDNPDKWPLKPIMENHHLNPDVPEFIPRSVSMNFTLGKRMEWTRGTFICLNRT
jgi:hypothetical protein